MRIFAQHSSKMEKILSYPLSILFYLWFGLLLCIFQPIQWFCLKVFGYKAHKLSVDVLNILSEFGLLVFTFNRMDFSGIDKIPHGRPLIVATNHQSMYEIVALIVHLRRFHPKFVAKKELGKGIPSVSFNLRHGGSVLIDRKDGKQALPEIKKMAEYIAKHNRSAVIFPEGTRSKTGKPKEWSQNGLKILCKFAPSAVVVPISINNSYKLVKHGFFPLGLGNRVTFTVHNPLPVKDYPFDALFEKAEKAVVDGLKY